MIEPLDICVMLGGPSEEREVSLQSGSAVTDALRSLGHRVSEIDPVDGEFRLPQKTEVVFRWTEHLTMFTIWDYFSP